MIRALAMLSYVYQSASALVLIVCLSHLLPAEVYITVSLVLASAQLGGVLAFEWIQLAGVRYLASATEETAPGSPRPLCRSPCCCASGRPRCPGISARAGPWCCWASGSRWRRG